MSNEPRRPILYNGEVYVSPVEKGSGGGTKQPNITYEVAREKILSDINRTKEVLRRMPDDSRLPNEVVLCLRMQPEFSAKSYYPDSLFDLDTQKFGLQEIGSRVWRESITVTAGNEEEKQSKLSGKLFFVRSTESGLDRLEQQLNRRQGSLTQKFTNDIRKLSSIDILTTSEQILGFSDNWQSGRLEAVLHPFVVDREVAVKHFLSLLDSAGVSEDRIKFRQYGDGITFVSFFGDKEVLSVISGYNPLRTVHPLLMRALPNVNRGTAFDGGALPPDFKQKSSIVVGVIDGGAEAGNPYLNNYIEIQDTVSGALHPDYASHGMQVCGAVLYGPLNRYSSKDKLPEPVISVKSFRVISQESSDPDLYDAIDAIEDIVPANKDIVVYNLSLGPRGPILDDSISRFTFACDLLSWEHKVLFCVAVGNDGEIDGYDRIQAPSDMVNGLAIGAYTKRDGVIERSPYSCVGPGREGNKMKPDLSAFGGCDQHPIHLVAPTIGKKILSSGTSFASPIVAGVAGQLIGENNKTIDSLVARALLIHSARNNNASGLYSLGLGHGTIPDDIDQIITCSGKSYTLIYRGEIEPKKYAQFTIPWIKEIDKGKVTFKWTTAVLTNIDSQSPDDYTTSSIETSFYANQDVYTFKKGTKQKKVNIETDKEKIAKLIDDGWTQLTFPASSSAQSSYKTEEELRQDFKWDSVDSRSITKMASGVKNRECSLNCVSRFYSKRCDFIRSSKIMLNWLIISFQL